MVRTLFIGTSEFAVPVVERIVNSDNFNLTGVITQPDRPVGRHHSDVQPTPVKEYLQENKIDIEISQPEKIKNGGLEFVKNIDPEIIIVASYGQIIPKDILDYPKYKCLNIHGSILPKLRGAVPIQMAILKGFETTGVTIQIMVPEMDAGEIIATKELKISDKDTSASLTSKLSVLGAELLDEVIVDWINGNIDPIDQDDTKATFCYKRDIAKEKAEIEWSKSVVEIDRMIRAFYPWPVAWTNLKSYKTHKQEDGLEADEKFSGKKLKIFRSRIVDSEFPHKKGGKVFRHNKQLIARAHKGWMEILECQLQGKKRLPAKQYLYLAYDKTERVRGLLIHEGKIMAIFRKKGEKEYYVSPGGSVGVNETREQALIREFKEETNLDVTVGEYLYDFRSDVLTMHHLYMVHLKGSPDDVRIIGEEKEYDSDENYFEPKWIDLKDVENLKFNSRVKKIIREKYFK